MSEKKDQLKEILKDQLNREAKQIEEEVGLNDNEEIPNELKIRMKNALDQKIREREMRSEDYEANRCVCETLRRRPGSTSPWTGDDEESERGEENLYNAPEKTQYP